MKISLPQLHDMKLAGTPIVMVTAYDHPSGRIVDCYAFTNEPEREYQDTGNREEQGRIDDLATAKLDQ